MSWDDDDWETSANLTLPGAVKAPTPAFDDEEEVVVSSEEDQPKEKSRPRKPKDDGKVKAKAMSKAKKKELEQKLAEEAQAAKNLKPMTKEEKIAEKLRLQKLVEEADHEIADDLFNMKKEAGVFDRQSLQTLLQTVPLETEAQYRDFADAIGRRVELEDNALYAKEFLKEIGRSIGRAISGDDLAEVISVLGVVKNEKVKQKLNKKKKKTGKAFANVPKHDDFDMDAASNARYAGGGGYDDIDGDFM